MKRKESMAFSALWLGAAFLGKGTREISILRNVWNLVGSNIASQKKIPPKQKT